LGNLFCIFAAAHAVECDTEDAAGRRLYRCTNWSKASNSHRALASLGLSRPFSGGFQNFGRQFAFAAWIDFVATHFKNSRIRQYIQICP